MHIPEGLFVNRDNQKSARLANKGFEPTTEDNKRKWIGTVYAKGILGGKEKIQYEFSEHSWLGSCPSTNLGSYGIGRDRH